MDISRGHDSAGVAVALPGQDILHWDFQWMCEKFDELTCRWVNKKMGRDESSPVGTLEFQKYQVTPDDVVVVPGNLLLNEGIQRLLDLLIGAGGANYANATAFIGVGDTATAAAATDTELLATANAANRFYKGMVATWPQRTSQTVDWKSDFTGTEANFVWNEWTIAAGATTASGSGFLVGTTNLNRKVQSLGTKASGTWTLTGSVTIS